MPAAQDQEGRQGRRHRRQDKGKTGEVLEGSAEENARLIVQGVNMVKRHTQPQPG